MQIIYPFLISFILIFISELGDKTQLLVLSFSAKNKASNILLGVAFGTLLSHGLAIAFGAKLGIINNYTVIYYLKLITCFTFLLFGIYGFIQLKKFNNIDIVEENNSKSDIFNFLTSLTSNCIFIVTICIAIGELGDKTFLSSIGLGLQYPSSKFPLICGSVCGMVVSNSIAIFFGKWLSTRISDVTIEIISNLIFIIFGLLGILGNIIMKNGFA